MESHCKLKQTCGQILIVFFFFKKNHSKFSLEARHTMLVEGEAFGGGKAKALVETAAAAS